MSKKRSKLIIALLIAVMVLTLNEFPINTMAANQQTLEYPNQFGIVTTDGLNVRTEPTVNADVISVLKKNYIVNVTQIIHTADKEHTTWLRIRFNESIGYVSIHYVNILENEPANSELQYGVVTSPVVLTCEPNTSSTIKEILQKGEFVHILDYTIDNHGKWYIVQLSSGNIGWVSAKHLKLCKWTLGSTATTLASASSNRDHNIALVGSFITGEFILPTEEFSWFETVGGCSKDKGFLPATIYVNGVISTGYGGGACQVSTTINIAIKGLGIKTNASQHSLPVSYANRKDEASVSYPYVNFSFENTLDNPIMLEVISSNGCCMCNVYVLQ